MAQQKFPQGHRIRVVDIGVVWAFLASLCQGFFSVSRFHLQRNSHPMQIENLNHTAGFLGSHLELENLA